MEFVDRLWRVVRANVNDWIDRAEDPEKLLENTVMELQENMVHLRKAVAEATAVQKRTEREYQQAQVRARDWQRRAELSVQKGDESLAREALLRRKPYLETARMLEEYLDEQRSRIDRLRHDLHLLEGKIAETKAKRQLYMARARAAKSTEQLHQAMDRFNPQGTAAALERMEARVQELEAHAEVAAQWELESIEQKFQTLETTPKSSVDEELAAMKTRLQAGEKPRSTQSHEREKKELEELRSRLNEI
ncbi:PspA/IM30 family protein [Roseofilum casamattae]|uniref:PspA/IM30 family protein n=1 Tax=Roseofilum casamattae BLCC-M143 TaxID=3022442 RepID=A0ABT7BTT1_9CYAN|nr:PspA/IM30 family protein [Roseofilum casamattae]MDJ1182595.1 PspA/IM30 family protein [Roseofilum casamattae BLCC-M143]